MVLPLRLGVKGKEKLIFFNLKKKVQTAIKLEVGPGLGGRGVKALMHAQPKKKDFFAGSPSLDLD